MFRACCKLPSNNKILSFPITSLLINRKYAASAAISPITVTKSKTGITTVSIKDSTPASSVSLVVKAGPRYETINKIGAAHYLKNFAFKNTTNKTAFRITRETELLGGVLAANLTRENLILTAEFLPDNLEYFLGVLSDVIFNTKYEPHEFKEVKQSVAFERSIAEATPEVLALEAAHEAAFRDGLGNLLFANSTTKIKSNEDVIAYANKVYTAPNITIIGTGVDHDKLTALTENLFKDISHAVPATPIASKYFGGEVRLASGNDINHYILAFEGAPAGTPDFYTLQILRSLLDGDKHTKWGDGITKLSQTANKLDTKTSTFNTGYSDAGIFGVYYSAAKPTSIYSAARATVEQLQHVAKGVDKDEFQRAFAKAKYSTAISYDTRYSKTVILGSQVLSSAKIVSASEAVSEYDHIKETDIANRILSSKPTAVALGDIATLPYADALSL
nr:14306_t:CDS:2 [Entrophospora candida]CAG8579396.1 11441_t:CDS:2 [Entrophospora candida]